MKRVLTLMLLVFPLYLTGVANGQDLKPLQDDIDNLKKRQAIIVKELKEIKELLRRGIPKRTQFKGAVLDIGDDPFMGNKNAVLTMIEFTDYDCTYCARYVRETFPKIEKNYIKTGKIKYILMDYPIESLHKEAFRDHEVANCAGEQDKYWEAHARLFKPNSKAPDDLTNLAKTLGLNIQEFETCVESGKYSDEIKKDQAQGRGAGVSGTPTFFFGLTVPNSSAVKVTKSSLGAQPYQNFVSIIESMLKEKKK